MSYIYAYGDGSTQAPYEINTLEDLNGIRYHLDKSFLLKRSLDFNKGADYADINNQALWTTGYGWLPIGDGTNKFVGVFDGGGKSINGLYLDRTGGYKGLFGCTTGATVKNLCLTNINIRGNHSTGGVIGAAEHNTVIQSCGVTGVINGWGNQSQVCQGFGGICAYLYYATMENCYSYVDVTLTPISHPWAGYAGSLTGWNRDYCSVIDCYSTGRVINPSEWYTGALIGGTLIGTSSVVSSYWDLETSLRSNSTGGVGKTTAQMKQQATFVNWDFVNTWSITENATYPLLKMSVIIPKVVFSGGKLLVVSGRVVGQK